MKNTSSTFHNFAIICHEIRGFLADVNGPANVVSRMRKPHDLKVPRQMWDDT